MELANCKQCGRLYYKVSDKPFCTTCWKDIEDKIHEIEEYVDRNHLAELETVAEACHIDPEQIKSLMRDKRINFSLNSPMKIPCESCGKMIHSGKLCDNCRNSKAEMINTLSRNIDKSHKNW